MATPPGFEPRLSVPKTLVLPLHHGVKPFLIYTQSAIIQLQENGIVAFGDFFNAITREND